MRGTRARLACLSLSLLLFGGIRWAAAQDDFYRGKTLTDPEFVNDARQAQLDIDPISGEDVTRLIGELFTMPPAVLTKLKELLR